MAAKSKIDQYANMAAIVVTESAAHTLTTTKLAFPFSIMDKMALLIHRIEYEFRVMGPSVLTTTGNRVTLALLAAASVLDIDNPVDPLVLDSARLNRYDYGTAASGFALRQPYVKDFSNLPGGGLLVAPNPLYCAVKGYGTAQASEGGFRIYYTYMELNTDEYWQLVESRRVISS